MTGTGSARSCQIRRVDQRSEQRYRKSGSCCQVILVEDIATPAEDRPAAIRRFHAKPRGNERAAIHLVEILVRVGDGQNAQRFARSEEHTSELQSLMRISYAVFCLKKKKTIRQQTNTNIKL